MRVLIRLSAIAAGLLAAAAAGATDFSVVAGSTRALTVASYGPVGESFVAQDGILNSFGFQFGTGNASAPNADVTFQLLSGAGAGGTVIATRTATVPLISGRGPAWFDFGLGATPLVVGQTYTALVSTTSARLGIYYGANAADAYAGGALVASRAVTDCTANVSCDVNFRFTGTAVAAVPEPRSWAMMAAGFGLAGAGLRRARRAAPKAA